MHEKMEIDDLYFLSPPGEAGDEAAYVQWLNEKQIYDRTLAIPFPYSESDATWFINHVRKEAERLGKAANWVIRRKTDGILIGGGGFHGFNPLKPHAAEIGYWLALPYWGKGIMTRAVGLICEAGRSEFGLVRIEAPIFAFNAASQRVLEKNGFVEEGYLRKAYLKEGKYLDGKLFAKIY